jgi:iron complex outermembrane receptor protein
MGEKPSMSSRTRLWAAGVCALASGTALGGEPSRQIEEVIVTAEKREATVSDTSISITAIDASMLEELGMQGPDDLVNYTPATTRDAYDIRIRGVGRNFRTLGGDPGVATYYNGVYSEDFGIASTDNALYDVQRGEVLRGPQGTLYGRNAIGGALNYLTNPPTMNRTGEARTQCGNLGAKEYYGILSGPILEDMLAFRLTGIKLMRDGSQEGYNESEDVNTLNDRNVSIALLFQPIESITANVRFNDRRSDRDTGTAPLINEGPNGSRGARDTVHYGYGLRPVTSTTPGALPVVHPVTGATLYGVYVRPGVDSGPWPHQPNPAFQSPAARLNNGGGDEDDVDPEALTNGPNDGVFEHAAVTFDVAWDTAIGTFKYIFGYGDFEYTFDIDNDFSDEGFSQYRQVVLEDVYNYSHEFQYLWEIGDSVTGTTGLHNFYSRRRQDYGLINATAQGR